jgi:peptidoglycan/LPS O-acetylase OafA/YrhL
VAASTGSRIDPLRRDEHGGLCTDSHRPVRARAHDRAVFETLTPLLLVLFLGVTYLRFGRSPEVKRWMLPLTTAGITALLALYFASTGGGDFIGYAIGVPLALSIGLALQVLFDFCRRCGAARSLSANLAGAITHPSHTARCPACDSDR